MHPLALWLLSGDTEVDLRHRIRYFSLYVAYWVAAFFYFFGASRFSALLAASVAKGLMALTAFHFVKRESKSPVKGLTTAAILMFDPTWVSRTNLLSDIYVAAGTVMTCSLAVYLYRHPTARNAFFLGAATGMTIGIKPTGVVLTILPLSMLLSPKHRAQSRRCVPGYLVGATLALIPLFANNLLEGDTLWWPDATHVQRASLARSRIGHDAAFFGTNLPTLSGMERVTTFRHNIVDSGASAVVGFVKHDITTAWILAIIGFAILTTIRENRRVHLAMALALALLAASTIFLTIVVRYESRYYLQTIAPLVIAAMSTKRPTPIWNFYASLLVIAAICQVAISLRSPAQAPSTSQMAQFEEITEAACQLPDNAVVLTPDCWEFTFHSRHPSVVLPVVETWSEFNAVALRYNATHIVLFNKPKHCQLYDELALGRSHQNALVIYSNNDLVVAELCQDVPRRD